MSGEPIICNGKTLGWIVRTGYDHYWTIATFKPGSGYDSCKDILESTLDEDDEELITLDRMNDLKLCVGDPPTPIRDFQMTSKTTVEFKEGHWA